MMNMNMEHRMIIDNRSKVLKERNLSQCHFVHQKSHLDCPEFGPKPLGWQGGNYLPELYYRCVRFYQELRVVVLEVKHDKWFDWYVFIVPLLPSLFVPHTGLATLSLINFSLRKYLFVLLCSLKPICHWQHITRSHTLHIICITSILIINNLLYLQQINVSVKVNAIASRFLILEY